jgi:hypothetical protein
VDNSFFGERKKTIADLPQKLDSFLLGNSWFFKEQLLEVTVAKLLDYVVVVAAFHDIEDPNNILAFEQLHDLDFRKESVFEILIMVD